MSGDWDGIGILFAVSSNMLGFMEVVLLVCSTWKDPDAAVAALKPDFASTIKTMDALEAAGEAAH